MKILIHLLLVVVLIANKASADFLQCYVCEDCAENEGLLEYCESFEEEIGQPLQETTTQVVQVGATTAATEGETNTVTQGYATTTTVTYMETENTTNSSPNAVTTEATSLAPAATIPSTDIDVPNNYNQTTATTNSNDNPLENTTSSMSTDLDMSTTATTFNNETATTSEITQMATEPYVTEEAEDNATTTENINPTSNIAEGNVDLDSNITETTEHVEFSTQEIMGNVDTLNFTRPSENMTTIFGNETTEGLENGAPSLESATTEENETILAATELFEPLKTSNATLFNAGANETTRPTIDLLELISTGNTTVPGSSLNGTIDGEVSEGTASSGNTNINETVTQNLNGTLQGIFNNTNFERPDLVRPNGTITAETSSDLFGNMTAANEALMVNGPSSMLTMTNLTADQGLLNNTIVSGKPNENSSSLLAVMNNTNLEADTLNNTIVLGLNGISNVLSENITNALRPNGTTPTEIVVDEVSENITLKGFNNTVTSAEFAMSRGSTVRPLEFIEMMKPTAEVLESLLSAESAEEANDLEENPSGIFEDIKDELIPSQFASNKYRSRRFAAQIRKDNITYKCYTVRVKGKNKVQINKGCIAVPAEKNAHNLLANKYGLRALEDLQVCSVSKCNRSKGVGMRIATKSLVVIMAISWLCR